MQLHKQCSALRKELLYEHSALYWRSRSTESTVLGAQLRSTHECLNRVNCPDASHLWLFVHTDSAKRPLSVPGAIFVGPLRWAF